MGQLKLGLQDFSFFLAKPLLQLGLQLDLLHLGVNGLRHLPHGPGEERQFVFALDKALGHLNVPLFFFHPQGELGEKLEGKDDFGYNPGGR